MSISEQVKTLESQLATEREINEAARKSSVNLANYCLHRAMFNLPMSGNDIMARDTINKLRLDLDDAHVRIADLERQFAEAKAIGAGDPPAQPDPYEHLPQGGWWYFNLYFLFHYPSNNDEGKRFTLEGEPHLAAGTTECIPWRDFGIADSQKLTRAQAVAIIEKHKAEQGKPEVAPATTIQDHTMDAVKYSMQPDPTFKLGDRVRHCDSWYGDGTVIGYEGDNVRVQFLRGVYHCPPKHIETIPAPAEQKPEAAKVDTLAGLRNAMRYGDCEEKANAIDAHITARIKEAK